MKKAHKALSLLLALCLAFVVMFSFSACSLLDIFNGNNNDNGGDTNINLPELIVVSLDHTELVL